MQAPARLGRGWGTGEGRAEGGMTMSWRAAQVSDGVL